MKALMAASHWIDAVSSVFGKISDYLVLICALVSAGNAMMRYLFNYSSNFYLEIQWYMFGFMVMMGASWTLRKNEHVRVDLVYGSLSDRGRLWVDIIGFIVFLLPVTAFLTWACWPYFFDSWRIGEQSQNTGGIIRWPVKLLLVLGFALLFLQGLSELIKRIAALRGMMALDTKYEKPLQ